MSKITPTMIDDELVDKICEHIGYHQGVVRIVFQVLTWLANNPIPLPEFPHSHCTYCGNKMPAGQSRACFMGAPNGLCTWSKPHAFGEYVEGLKEFQRIAYLKKEPEIPLEVKSLLWVHNPFPNRGAEHRHNEAVLAAYKLGLSRK